MNQPPSAPTVSLTPSAPFSTQSLTAAITSGSVDPEGQSVTYAYEWLLGGLVQPAYTGLAVLPAVATTSGDTWTVSIVGFDGWASSPPGTASATVQGSVPSITGVSLTPTVGLSTTSFAASASGWFDADNDPPGYLYAWSVAGSLVAGASAATFTPTGASPGDSVAVEVTPWDGANQGTPLTAFGAVNTPPTVSNVTLPTTPLFEGGSVTGSFGSTADVDGQTVTVTWSWEVDGFSVSETSNTLGSVDFDSGETVVAFATPHDGLQAGTAVPSNGVLVSDSPPTAPVVTIDPQLPASIHNLFCEVTTASVDADLDAITYAMTWTVNGSPYFGATATAWPGDTVPSSATAPTDDWECTATPTAAGVAGPTATDLVSVAAGCTGVSVTVEGASGNIIVCTNCTQGDFSCEAREVCETVTNQTCVHQTYDCATGSLGSWYPSGISGASGSGFSFAYAYDFWGSSYGNICDCNPDDSTQFGLYRGHQYCGTGHWFRN